MMKNKAKRIFCIALKEKQENDLIIVYPENNKVMFFSDRSEAEAFFNELIANKSYTQDQIEIISLWHFQNP